MTTLAREGRTVGFSVEGEGTPLLAFHGTTQSRNAWDGVRGAMSVPRAWVSVDFPGSGESTLPEGPLEIDDIVADAVAVMDHLGHDLFDVTGFSLGAVVALRAAARHPDRVRTVTSLCGWSRSDARMRLTFSLWRRLIALGPDVFMHYALVDGYTAGTLESMEPLVPSVLDMAAGMVQPGSDAHLELDGRIDIEECLAEVSVPCLVMGAIEDRWVDIAASRHIASVVPGARLVELPGGHLVMGERPDLVAAHLGEHLAR
jgi:pimeloyl-ACP methyl ester carboxylesterase